MNISGDLAELRNGPVVVVVLKGRLFCLCKGERRVGKDKYCGSNASLATGEENIRQISKILNSNP